ncbi:hypothetical protein AB7Y49_06805 [Providencia vermicola]|uniref:Integrase n=1 Tax=Providencia vermicola TaxID=333965 RepID=A0AAX3RZR2_9GAMM|nr:MULTISPECIES: hypothetical protein [Providencia]USB35600.1 hypothetical protein M5J11_12225 [Providencia vermicola]WFC08107.1 hypothetical protein PG365_06980 [Providencia vermicola]
MANEQYEKGKIKLSYSKKQAKKAGDNIRKNIETVNSVEIIRNFRAAHLYPLMIINKFSMETRKKEGSYRNYCSQIKATTNNNRQIISRHSRW